MFLAAAFKGSYTSLSYSNIGKQGCNRLNETLKNNQIYSNLTYVKRSQISKVCITFQV